jgi:hypothetical protein
MESEQMEDTEEMEDEEIFSDDQVAQNPMCDGVIHYRNTDLDLRSAEDLTPLAEAFKSYGMWQNHLIQEEDGNWFAIFEAGCCGAEPDQTITMLLDVIEALAPEYQAIWSRCTVKEWLFPL